MSSGVRSRAGGLWLLLVPVACCGGPALIAGLAAAGALAWGGIGLALALAVAGAVTLIRHRRRAFRAPGPARRAKEAAATGPAGAPPGGPPGCAAARRRPMDRVARIVT